ncbi:hypothetical protein X961_2871 [Burkholderia pseudomallei MSHR5613]|nr:hypothetical protein X977_3203 [Burkholderia pseudomallei MSHR7504]KGS50116.1 hypothetical protein X961_2871 [Burkholderia pseudomallei MSHR5613]
MMVGISEKMRDSRCTDQNVEAPIKSHFEGHEFVILNHCLMTCHCMNYRLNYKCGRCYRTCIKGMNLSMFDNFCI